MPKVEKAQTIRPRLFGSFASWMGAWGPSYPSGVQNRLAATEKTDEVANAGCGSDHENRLLANSFA